MMTTTTTRRRTAFRMHHDGEVDVRATYCILTSCYLLKLLGREDDDDGTITIIVRDMPIPSSRRPCHGTSPSCQTCEGGFGAEPNNEAHGGYAFCAIASLRLLLLHRSGGAAAAAGGGRRLSLDDVIDVNALSSWLSRRQMGYEGGFSGRTNKLVDGVLLCSGRGGRCGVGSDAPPRRGGGWGGHDDDDDDDDDGDGEARSPTFDEAMLQRYILLCAQDVNGGLRDKPSKSRILTGTTGGDEDDGEEEVEEVEEEGRGEMRLNRLFGDAKFNVVGRTDPVINIRVERVRFMLSRRYR
ncbi:hypothetical protein ACHAW5_005894 [Stephanodiscus triporus]|uniref:Prenyltransferase alpha-alpha toroid domain-containing protein n=1 Tax=Stephanodiscus triporus TaxID=2934178 RepID=A0ABD3NJL3_9STRA